MRTDKIGVHIYREDEDSYTVDVGGLNSTSFHKLQYKDLLMYISGNMKKLPIERATAQMFPAQSEFDGDVLETKTTKKKVIKSTKEQLSLSLFNGKL
jgi:hypothetical protein